MNRLCLITRNFPPLKGGMERLNQRLHQLLVKHYEVVLYGPKACDEFVEGHKAIGSRVSPTMIFILLSFIRALAGSVFSKRFNFYVGGSGLVAPIVVVLAKLFGARAVILIHGLDIIVESKIYRYCFLPFIRAADLLVCNSDNTARLAIEHGADAERVTIVLPGAEITASNLTKEEAKKEVGAGEKTVLLSVGRLIPRKGLAEFIDNSLPSLVSEDPSLEFWIAGTEPERALNKNEFSVSKDIQRAIQRRSLNAHVKLLGSVSEERLELLYAAADVFVFPLREIHGDVEGFGMVAVEAAGYGTPTVAFDCGGVKDAVRHNETGLLVEAGDYAAFTKAVQRALGGFEAEKIIEFSKGFSWQRYGFEFRQQLEKFVENEL